MPEMEAENTQTHTHAPGCFVCQTAIPLLQKCWSDATRDHFRNSRVEFLKGLRSLIDDRISHLSREPQSKGTHVAVE
jgi:predicted amidohydrolase